MSEDISIVTLACNNVPEVFRTLESIISQSVGPDEFLLLDSSDEPARSAIEHAAHIAGATYSWLPPDGVYPAMNAALGMVDSPNHIWFVNSSDWLYGPDSVMLMKQALQSASTDWIIGGLHRYGDSRVPFHPLLGDGESTLKAMVHGRMGFAHPSAVMRKASIDALGGFDTHYAIAADYDLALRFFASFGAPGIVPEVVSVHQPTGLTSRNRVRHALEKSQIRRKETETSWANEVRNLGEIALASIFARQPMRGAVEKILPRSFCGGASSEGTLNCCVDWLDAQALELFRP